MNDCLFCKIIKGEIPCDKVYEDEHILCFKDIQPQAPVHVLIIPKRHISNVNELNEEDMHIIANIYTSIKSIAKELKVDQSGYRIVTNCGEHGGQTVGHIHFHLLGGRNLSWPPG